MDKKGLVIGSLGLLGATYIYSNISWARYIKKQNRLKAEDDTPYCIMCASYDEAMLDEPNFEQYLSREHEAHKVSLKLAKALEKMHHEMYTNAEEEMLLNVKVIAYDGPEEDDVEVNWWTDDWGPEISRDIDPSNLIYDLPQAYVYEKYSDSPTKALARYDEGKVNYYRKDKYGVPFIEIHIPNDIENYKDNILSITPLKR